jgi:hypothetical protein
LAVATPGISLAEWTTLCHKALPSLSIARRRELIRLLRDGFLEWTTDQKIAPGLFLKFYADAPATAQIDIVNVQWALSHPITLIGVERLVAPALASGNIDIPLSDVEKLVSANLDTRSAESLRKTRTVLLGAMEGMGTLVTRGTGQHRQLSASRGRPHPLTFAYLVHRDLQERGLNTIIAPKIPESSLGVRLSQCTFSHARFCMQWALDNQLLTERDDEIGLPR